MPYEGAAGAFPITSSPGNVQGLGTTAAAQALSYPIPAAGIGPTGQLTLAQLGSSANPNKTSLYSNLTAVLPEIRQDALAVNFKQDIGSFIHAFAFGYAYRSQGYQDYRTDAAGDRHRIGAEYQPLQPVRHSRCRRIGGIAPTKPRSTRKA